MSRCPFPGMDPYLEGEGWGDFHGRFNFAMSDFLNDRVGDGYLVRAERRVYEEDEPGTAAVPDNLVFEVPSGFGGGGVATATATAAPVVGTIPKPDPGRLRRETYLVVREMPAREIVTVIETLSPANRRRGEGRRRFLEKREEVLESDAHWVEIDLLRGGEPTPLGGTLPPHTYRAVVSRVSDRPRCDIFPWTLAEPLPTIPVPLKPADGHVSLEMQSIFDTIYDRARYHREFDHAARGPVVPFTPAEERFARTLPGVLTDVSASV